MDRRGGPIGREPTGYRQRELRVCADLGDLDKRSAAAPIYLARWLGAGQSHRPSPRARDVRARDRAKEHRARSRQARDQSSGGWKADPSPGGARRRAPARPWQPRRNRDRGRRPSLRPGARAPRAAPAGDRRALRRAPARSPSDRRDAPTARSAACAGDQQVFRDTEALLAAVFHATADAIVISRASDGLIHEVNDAAVHLFGYEAEELRGRSTFEMDLWERRKHRDELVAAAIAERSPQQARWRYGRRPAIYGSSTPALRLLICAERRTSSPRCARSPVARGASAAVTPRRS